MSLKIIGYDPDVGENLTDISQWFEYLGPARITNDSIIFSMEKIRI